MGQLTENLRTILGNGKPVPADTPVSRSAGPGLEALACPSWRVNRPVLPEGDPRDRMAIVHEAIAAWVEETLKRGRRPVSIAGDCCTSIGVLAGLQRAGVHPTLIWFDAHGDFNTPETTPSGFLGGMPLAMITGRVIWGCPLRWGWEPWRKGGSS